VSGASHALGSQTVLFARHRNERCQPPFELGRLTGRSDLEASGETPASREDARTALHQDTERAAHCSSYGRGADGLIERGYENATTAEIAARAGVVEGTIYHYFASKRELLIRILEEWEARTLPDYSTVNDRMQRSALPITISYSLSFAIDLRTTGPDEIYA